jgi:hypothetical protein
MSVLFAGELLPISNLDRMRLPPPPYFGWLHSRATARGRSRTEIQTPQPGSVILRGSGGYFELVDAGSHTHIAGPVQWSRAIQLARAHGANAVWQQDLDEHGRPLGAPFLIRRF